MDVPLVRTRITQLEDLRNAVKDAGLSAFQISREPPSGSLIHAADGGIGFSSGRFDSRVQIRGPMSADAVSIAVGLRIPPRNRLLLREIDSGVVTVFRPGDAQEAFHDVNSLYAVVTLGEETLEREAERHGLRLSPNAFRRTGIHPQPLALTHLSAISAYLAGVSRRTLARAFQETLGESPQSYIARMRLHRIRADLLTCGRQVTVAAVSNQWGIGELGRMAARYRGLFGESPSQTRARGPR
ncbi:AraC family transcriptional regulator [Mycolicibacterium farcinogenes]|uniref:Transcriptional regulator, AraC family n=1 Tax=Mycolicibacterium senegalense TaxID=1796 RepID=A0A378W2J4_9MYCO|nr:MULTISPECIES: helix-turn-helix domain-containing protein [Mycolicibacterium]CDP84638.1 AraC family transcriptional regulator [Mycolicibacterium farcinogenes]SUA27343.1 transcriptional regulator, AraC family [Mycolicibacterium senegalense]